MRLLGLVVCTILLCSCSSERRPVVIATDIDHQGFTTLLQRYVDDQGLIAYSQWRDSSEDRQALDAYLAQYEDLPETQAVGNERGAALINLYNALTIRAVLTLDPDASSFWTGRPFNKAIHTVGGQQVSLDDIEHGAVRPEVGYRGHAGLVCAAISCPPLPREAFTPDNLNQQLDDRMAVWLARDDLNIINPSTQNIEVSKIFAWFAEDFHSDTYTLRELLIRHTPADKHALLKNQEVPVNYMAYDKSLNSQ